MGNLKWSPIEERDEFEVVKAVHVMPVVMTENIFATEQEAQAFVKSLKEENFPCLTDDDNNVVATYFGHTVNVDCPCCPDARADTIIPTFVHRPIQ
jgi:hypothetical protein